MIEANKEKESNFYSVLPLKNVVAMPRNVIPVIVGREVSIKAVEYALKNKKDIFVTAQKSSDVKILLFQQHLGLLFFGRLKKKGWKLR